MSRRQLAAIATASAVGTALVIATAMGNEDPRWAMIAALGQRPVLVHALTPTPPQASAGTGSAPTVGVGDTSAASASSAGSSSAASASAGAGPSSASSGASTPTTTSPPSTAAATKTAPAKTYKVKHVFVIALSAPSYEAAFGYGSVARYLTGTLRAKGTLLRGYQSLGHGDLSDYLAMVSGQAPNPDTEADCATYADFPASASPLSGGQLPGRGCIYPNTVLTIGDQVTAGGSQWKGYLQDMGKSTCVHANPGAPDNVQLPGAGSEYTTRHNPFVYFHSLLDLGDCMSDDVALDQLPGDLRTLSKTPRYAFITPGTCEDGDQQPCPDGKPGGLPSADAFLAQWVPRILSSVAYKRDGALVIVFTMPPPAQPPAGSGSTVTVAGHPVETGALVLSRYAKRGAVVAARYDPYSLLRSVEDLFGYKHLAHAARARSFVAAALPSA